MKNRLNGFREAAFLETLLVVLPPAIIGFLSAGVYSIASIIFLVLIVIFWDVGINVLNNHSDWHTDEVNKKRLSMHEHILREELLIFYFVLVIGSFLIAFLLLKPSIYFYLTLIIETLLGISYSMYVRLKDRFVVNYVTIAIMYGLFSFLLGFFATNSSTASLLTSLPIIIFITILYFSICIVKDYSDMKGDAAHHRKSIPLLLGTKKTLNLQYALITSSYILLLLFIVLGYLNILFLSTFLLYFSLIYILSGINKTQNTKQMRRISLFTKINTLILDILIIIIFLLKIR